MHDLDDVQIERQQLGQLHDRVERLRPANLELLEDRETLKGRHSQPRNAREEERSDRLRRQVLIDHPGQPSHKCKGRYLGGEFFECTFHRQL
jgi:hypothetical protein